MFILSATTHSAALLAALSAEPSRVTKITKTTAGLKPAAAGEKRTRKTRNSFRIVCPLKVNITLQKLLQLVQLCNCNCCSDCNCDGDCNFQFQFRFWLATFWQRQSTIFIASCTCKTMRQSQTQFAYADWSANLCSKREWDREGRVGATHI